MRSRRFSTAAPPALLAVAIVLLFAVCGRFDRTAEWPSDLPPGVPKFETGRLESASRSSAGGTSSWFIRLGDVSAKEVRGYIEALKSSGWTAVYDHETGGTIVFAGSRDNVGVSVTSLVDEKTVTLCVHAKTPPEG